MPRWPSVHQAVTLRDHRISDSSFVRLADYAALQNQYESEQYDELGELTSSALEPDMKYACGTISTMVDTLNLTPMITEIPQRSPLRPRPLSLLPRSLTASTVPSARSSMVESTTGSETYSEPTSERESEPVSRPISQVEREDDDNNETEPHPDDDESQIHPAYRRRPFSVYSNMSTPPPLSPSSPYGTPSTASLYSSDALSLTSRAASNRSQSPTSTYAAIAANTPWGAVVKPHEADSFHRTAVGKVTEPTQTLCTSSLQPDPIFGRVDGPKDSSLEHIPIPERSQKRSASRMTKDSRRSLKLSGGSLFRKMLARA